MSTITLWIVIGLMTLAEAAIIVAALRMKVKADPSRGILGARPMEVLWTLLPAGLLAALAVVSFGAN